MHNEVKKHRKKKRVLVFLSMSDTHSGTVRVFAGWADEGCSRNTWDKNTRGHNHSFARRSLHFFFCSRCLFVGRVQTLRDVRLPPASRVEPEILPSALAVP